jgi:ATP-dependent Lon protease
MSDKNKLCKYIYKRGVNKGELCNEITSSSSYCIKHEKKMQKELQSATIIKVETTDNFKKKILSLETTLDNKTVILKHYNNMKRLEPNSTEYYKNQLFVDLAISFPWNKKFDINVFLKETSIKTFITFIKQSFDDNIYGMDNVKNEIINILCKFITNPNSNRNNIALCGAPGVGKSKFIRIIAEILDIPFKVISLGGIKDSSFFLGHGYVYVESGPGKILQNIIDSKISNPIIYFDELDKVSETEHGKDIYSFLSYLTDPSQNIEYTDHYFYGMKFDLSKVFYVFTFNNVEKIDKVLLDRLNVINVQTPNKDDISVILHKHCIPEIISNIGIKANIDITLQQVKMIMSRFIQLINTHITSGIREYYRILEKILLEINKDILLEKYTLLNDEQFENYIINLEKQLIIQDNASFQHMYV